MSSPARRVIHKVGGSVLRDTESFHAIRAILQWMRDPAVLVFSACKGITDRLIHIAHMCTEGRRSDAMDTLQEVHATHVHLARQLLHNTYLDRYQRFYQRIRQISQAILTSAVRLQEVPPAAMDRFLSIGELSSSYLVYLYLRQQGEPAGWVDARRFLITDTRYGNARPLLRETRARIRRVLTPALEQHRFVVVPGFIGRSVTGRTTTLGRGGSDLTATLVAVGLRAERVYLWTDVPGMMSADPRIVPSAFTIPSIPYEEAVILSHFGVKKFHPRALWPVYRRGIPVHIKDLYHPDAQGTTIELRAELARGLFVIAYLPRVTVIRMEFPLFGRQSLLRRADWMARRLQPLAISMTRWPPSISAILQNGVDESLLRQLQRLKPHTLRDHQGALVLLIGRDIDHSRFWSALQDWDARILHDWATFHILPILIPTEQLETCIRTLHNMCFAIG